MTGYQKRASISGFTLVEVLVVIAIIGVLLGLVMPATQSLREMARRSTCQQNLIELSLALSAYHDAQGHYPTGTIEVAGPIQSVESGFHHNWISALLPHLESQAVHDAINFQVGVYAPENAVVRQATFPFLLCPSSSMINLNTSCYAAVHHSTEAPIDESNDGVFILNRVTTNRDILDGLSYTLFLGEKKSVPEFDLGWMSGTRTTLRNTGHAIGAVDGSWPHLILSQPTEPTENNMYGYQELTLDGEVAEEEPATVETPAEPAENAVADPINPLFVGGFQSDHPGGVHLLTGAGEISFRSTSMDQRLMQQMANKADGQIPLQVLDPSNLVPATTPATQQATE